MFTTLFWVCFFVIYAGYNPQASAHIVIIRNRFSGIDLTSANLQNWFGRNFTETLVQWVIPFPEFHSPRTFGDFGPTWTIMAEKNLFCADFLSRIQPCAKGFPRSWLVWNSNMIGVAINNFEKEWHFFDKGQFAPKPTLRCVQSCSPPAAVRLSCCSILKIKNQYMVCTSHFLYDSLSILHYMHSNSLKY